MASLYLQKKGFVILHRNYTMRWGEIDIIARKGEVLVFVEVKPRTGHTHGTPANAIGSKKLLSLIRSCTHYASSRGYRNTALQIDAISVYLNPDGSVRNLVHYENIVR
ncbi:MAG: YraN family protein [Patescibacteria group bacterium]|nr:YraN family protein [Patescibacteria group bacterium]